MRASYSQEAEMAVLGSLFYPNVNLDEIFSALNEHDFGLNVNKDIFRAVQSLHSRNMPIDLLVCKSELERLGLFEQIGGEDYLIRIAEFVPSPTNAGYYASLVKEMSRRRQIGDACESAIRDLRETELESSEILYGIDQNLKLIQGSVYKTWQYADEIDFESDAGIEEGILTGFPTIDTISGCGIVRGDTSYLSGETGFGKTNWALDITNTMLYHDRNVLYITLADLDKRKVCKRLVKKLCGWDRKPDAEHLQQGWFDAVAKVKERTLRGSLMIYDSGDVSTNLDDIKSAIFDAHMKAGIDAFIVDYVQCVTIPKESNMTISLIKTAKELQQVAKKTNSVGLVLSQVNDEGELRWARDLNNYSGLTLYGKRDKQSNASHADVETTKSRYGPYVSFEMDFDHRTLIYREK